MNTRLRRPVLFKLVILVLCWLARLPRPARRNWTVSEAQFFDLRLAMVQPAGFVSLEEVTIADG
jgi:hypothetical protein